MRITVHDAEIAEIAHLTAAIAAAARWSTSESADIYAVRRLDSGWLEYTVYVRLSARTAMHIAVIQRKPGAEIETCS